MIALHHRERTGLGQQVDVSLHESIARLLAVVYPYWSYRRSVVHRTGAWILRNGERIRVVWPCKDGAVIFRLIGGGLGRLAIPLVEWMEEEGMAGILKEVDWKALDMPKVTAQEMESWEKLFGRFLLKHTKAALLEQAVRRRLFLLPVHTPREVREDHQLESRDFWVEVEHPELGGSLSYPGAPYKFQRTPWRIGRRAPLIGEHNEEVFAELKAHPASKGPGHKESSSLSRPKKALEGVKVADFGWFEAAPLATKYIADFGAQVIKVESGKSPDLLRVTYPFQDDTPGVNRSGVFQLSNSSKLSLALDLDSPRGLAVARRLAAWADVVVENSTPGRMKSLGLGYDDLVKIKPDIIMLSSSILGQTGPLSRHPGLGYHISGLAGFNHLTGWPDRDGIWPHIPYPDYIAPWYGAVAILSALDHRQRTGHGQHIDLSQFEASLSFLSPALLDFTANGREQIRQGNRSPYAAPHGAYPCQGDDRWCAIAVFTQEEWRAFSQVIGDPEWTRDPRFADLQARKKNEEELDALVSGWTLARSAEEVMALMQEAGLAAGVVQSIQDLLDRDTQLRHRDFFPILHHTEQGPCLHMRMPIKLSKTPDEIRPTPCLGEHTEYVCTQILGMPDDEFLELLADGILQ
jgi:benzylsuccinate CoA-transferase BbsF subunit